MHNFDSGGTDVDALAYEAIQCTEDIHGGKMKQCVSEGEVRSDGCRSMRVAAAASQQDDREGWTACFGIKLTGREGRRECIKAAP